MYLRFKRIPYIWHQKRRLCCETDVQVRKSKLEPTHTISLQVTFDVQAFDGLALTSILLLFFLFPAAKIFNCW